MKELEALLFDGVIKQRKVRYINGQDYPYTRKLDDKTLGREQELTIHLVTPLSDNHDNLTVQRMQSMGRDELRVILPADVRFMQDLTLHQRTEKYIRQNSNTQQEAVKRILDAKGFQNTERLAELRERAKILLGHAQMIINAGDLEVGGEDGQARILKGFHQLIEITYPNLRMLRDVPFGEADIGKYLRQGQDGLLGNDATRLTEAELELLAFIQGNTRGGVRTTVKSLLERFERKNYGWYYAAILCNLALLRARGKIEIRQDSNPLEGDPLERALRNTAAHASLILEPQIEFTAAQVRALKDFFADFFNRPASANEARALARETRDALKDLEVELVALHGKQGQYPFLAALDGVLATLKELAARNSAWFLTDLARAEDALLDTKEQLIDPLRRFMTSPQQVIFDQARQLVAEEEDNFPYVGTTDVQAIRDLLQDPKPWRGNRLQQAKPQVEALRQAIANRLASEQASALSRLAEWEKRLMGAEDYPALGAEQQAGLTAPFAQMRQALQGHKRIALIRDQLRAFEEQQYPSLLMELERLAHPIPPSDYPSPRPRPEEGRVAEPKLIPARDIKVAYPRPWLATPTELDDYLDKLRAAWLKEIQAGNRVGI
jgi:hypothetical protein